MRIGLVGAAFTLRSVVLASQTASASVPTPLTYEAALSVAMSRNLNVAAARRARQIREAAIRTARQIPNPDVSFEAGRDTPHEIFSFDLPFEIGSKRGRRIDLATEELTLADLDLQTALREIRRELRQTFYSLIAADERRRIAESVLDIARRLRDAAQARFDAGAAPRLEVLQADLGVTRAETDLDLAGSVRAAAQASLDAVLDLPPQQTLVVAGSLSDRQSTISYDQALALATTSNTDLASLDRQMAIEERRADLLRAERVPTPVFSVSGVFNSPPDFTAGARAAISVGVPLFSRNQGEIAASVATTTQLRTRRDATRRTVENDVFATLAKIEAERRQVEAYEQRLVPTATSLESLAEESYRAGRTSVLAVLDAQRNLRDLTREALQAALDLQLSLADLEDLLGTALP
jgi:outer membrane protein, heavy metal efflux system